MVTLDLSSLQSLDEKDVGQVENENNIPTEIKPVEEKIEEKVETRKPLINLKLGTKKNTPEQDSETIKTEEVIVDKVEELPQNNTEILSLAIGNTSSDVNSEIINNDTLPITDTKEQSELVSIDTEGSIEEKITPKLSITSFNKKPNKEPEVENLEVSKEESVSILPSNEAPIQENKEFFTNFNIEDEFGFGGMLSGNTDESGIIENNTIISQEEPTKGLSIESQKIEEEKQEEPEVVIEQKVEEIEQKEELLVNDEINKESTQEVAPTDVVKMDTNDNTKDVAKIKEDLSADRKPAGVGVFKRKIIIASLGMFVLFGVIAGIMLGGDIMNKGKVNVGENNNPPKKIENNNPNGDNIIANTGTINGPNYTKPDTIVSSGTDFKIIKNTKRNIKKNKIHTGSILTNSGTIEISTGTIINTGASVNSGKTNTGITSTGITNSGTSNNNQELINGIQGK